MIPHEPAVISNPSIRRARTRAQRGAGFTLIEVLIAMTIIAVAMIGAIRATSSLARGSADLKARMVAQWSAENRLSEIRVKGLFPDAGRREFDCSQAGVTLRCVERVLPTPNRYFKRIELRVFNARNHRLVLITAFATNLPK